MKYMLLMYSNEAELAHHTPQADPDAVKTWMAFTKEAMAAGVMLASNGLLSTDHATNVRVRDGKTITADGPFAETHEALGGFFLFECKDLDEAIAWAAKLPTAAFGTIEIRPVYQQ